MRLEHIGEAARLCGAEIPASKFEAGNQGASFLFQGGSGPQAGEVTAETLQLEVRNLPMMGGCGAYCLAASPEFEASNLRQRAALHTILLLHSNVDVDCTITPIDSVKIKLSESRKSDRQPRL